MMLCYLDHRKLLSCSLSMSTDSVSTARRYSGATTGSPGTPLARAPVAAVTGAGRGIGHAIACELAAAGFDLLLLDMDRDDAAEQRVRDCAPERGVRFLQADIADIDARHTLVDAMFNCWGALDCLVNNAGVQVQVRGDLLDVTPESYDRVMGINLRGTFFLTQAVARRMLRTPAVAGVHRSVVTISSANAYLAGPDRPEYCMSKTALSMMTRMFALRLGAAGICTYEIRPGIIRTGMTAPAKDKYDGWIAAGLTPLARWGEPADVAVAVRTLAEGRMPFCTGAAFHVDGGLHIHKL